MHRNYSTTRGVSAIIGSMLMLLIIVAVGSTILVLALNNINMFNLALKVEEANLSRYRSGVIIENIATNTNSNRITIWLRNLGNDPVHINRITVFDMDTQQPIMQQDTNMILARGQLRDITYNLTLVRGHTYKIVINTSNDGSVNDYFSP
ncbi:hypothetical protein HRbin04_00447 [archaeon HR04]|nr:hypothetical protein HRbin04_00447 [archaeon HR04]